MSKEYKGAVCRGSWVLGSACGRCERCEDTKPTLGTASTGLGKPITIDDIKKVMQEINAIPENKDFMLVTPDGKMYKGEYNQILTVFRRYHPSIGFPVLDYGMPLHETTKPNDKE